ncbi:MAG: hypothetical protein U0840_27110 [Gemmataceae bacterium]
MHGESQPHDQLAVPFTPAELAEFRRSDAGAGAAVVVVVTLIFLIGLLLYTVVFLAIAG